MKKIKDQKLNIHIRISIAIFLILLFTRFIFSKVPIPYGDGQVTLGTLLLLFYGFYLIFVSCLYFNKTTFLWKKNQPWKKELITSYLLVLLFVVFITLVSATGDGLIKFTKLTRMVSFISDDFLGRLFFIGLSIVFPISIYTSSLSIKSLISAKKENKSYMFGIILLILSLILLVTSFISFWIILTFWIQGGTALI